MKTKANINELLKNVQNGGMSGVYKITRKSDGKVYIGQSICIRQRLEQHINNIYVDEDAAGIDAAIKKEGADKFIYETIVAAPDLTAEQLWFLEAYYIEAFDSYNNGFNRTRGNHRGAYDALDLRNKHKVTLNITKMIEENFRLNFRGKKVLLIGNFNRKFVDYIEYQDAVVTAIDAYETEDFIKKFNEEMENMESKDFDIIISNPPYGKVGCEITKRIIDEVDFREFVNLLPANDYIKRGKKYNLWQYVENVKQMVQVTGWKYFEDAAVTTHIAKIQKVPNLYLSADEFEIENFIDPQLTKFFYENNKREHYAIDKAPAIGYGVNNAGIWDVKTTIIIGQKDMHNCKMPIGDYASYNWNVEESIDMDFIINNKVSKSGQIQMSDIHFKTSIEKKNFVKFMYSKDGHEFYAKMWASMNIDGGVKPIGLIKVDWTEEWTVEEILKDYGYTKKEIEEVMEDIHNYRNRRK